MHSNLRKSWLKYSSIREFSDAQMLYEVAKYSKTIPSSICTMDSPILNFLFLSKGFMVSIPSSLDPLRILSYSYRQKQLDTSLSHLRVGKMVVSSSRKGGGTFVSISP